MLQQSELFFDFASDHFNMSQQVSKCRVLRLQVGLILHRNRVNECDETTIAIGVFCILPCPCDAELYAVLVSHRRTVINSY